MPSDSGLFTLTSRRKIDLNHNLKDIFYLFVPEMMQNDIPNIDTSQKVVKPF